MPNLKRVVLDVLKPHRPNVLELSSVVAALGADYIVRIDVSEVDEKTETVVVDIQGNQLDFAQIEQSIRDVGGSVHSIDKVLMCGDAATGAEASESAADG
jgi:hypothetical protein